MFILLLGLQTDWLLVLGELLPPIWGLLFSCTHCIESRPEKLSEFKEMKICTLALYQVFLQRNLGAIKAAYLAKVFLSRFLE